MPWLLNLIYLGVIALVSPILVYRAVFLGKYRTGWEQKLFGKLPQRDLQGSRIWFHAVSVGEVLQLRSVLGQLRLARPECEIIISTTTSTGHAVAVKQFPEHQVCYFPFDFSWSVRTAIKQIQPTAIVLVELELWPNFILAAHQAQIPVVLINGRISERSYRGYSRLPTFMTRFLLQKLTAFGIQNETYANRLIEIGAPPDRIRVTGSTKFDGLETKRDQPKTNAIRACFGIGAHEIVFIAGSTQAPEEQIALQTWKRLQQRFRNLRLILVPRHQERFEEVASLVNNEGLTLLRRSEQIMTVLECKQSMSSGDTRLPVCLLDTLGELDACWGLADIAFVGGSLTRRGGQNMIEPAAFGAAVLFGPHTWNFRDVVEALLERDAARVVRDADDLLQSMEDLLEHPDKAREQGRHAQQYVLSQDGATKKTISMICKLLPTKETTRNAA